MISKPPRNATDIASDLSAARLRSLLEYDPDSGLFTRYFPKSKRVSAGSLSSLGYRKLYVAGRPYYAHRLAWLYVYGVWPSQSLDHIDGCRGNNKIANLRDVSHSTNMQNRKRSLSSNKLGILGCSVTLSGKIMANINVGGTNKYLGSFDTAVAAHEAYLIAKRAFHEGCTI